MDVPGGRPAIVRSSGFRKFSIAGEYALGAGRSSMIHFRKQFDIFEQLLSLQSKHFEHDVADGMKSTALSGY
jgi:hypothetical protein